MSWSAAERFPCRFRKPRAEEIVLLRSFPAPGEIRVNLFSGNSIFFIQPSILFRH